MVINSDYWWLIVRNGDLMVINGDDNGVLWWLMVLNDDEMHVSDGEMMAIYKWWNDGGPPVNSHRPCQIGFGRVIPIQTLLFSGPMLNYQSVNDGSMMVKW